jgi:hypothetical protein
MKYYINHFLVSLAIDLAMYFLTGGFFYGAMFYTGREVRDMEKLGFIDWKGWIAPMIASLLFFLLIILNYT